MEIKTSTKFVAELIGTFGLVLFGCGAAAVAGASTIAGLSGLGLLGIAFAFGLSVVVFAYAIGGISGCHINPAVTIGVLVAGKISAKDAVVYIIAQLIGALLGAFVLQQILNGQLAGFSAGEWAYGSNGWGKGYQNEYGTTAAFLTEAVLTFLFLFVILATTSKVGNSTMAGLAIGLTLVLIHLVAIPITGTSVNPARSFGPAILAGGAALQQLWLFILAPVAGAIVAAVVWRALYSEPK
ncbi:MIP family channel protein [Sphingobacterium spiritivorum]|uniref:MIP family channel protein n=1 Tax=Sphingobacterium spiritivorum ATCC 33861 TaxID=525373 RepID=D7VJ39_SPHSI|nr:MIP family channel protein [Sphingobacterium spiritivorum]EFK59174.1 MIP family channel protein [Sphingobacterium spiritivorum ATCC 33861]QQT34187.1 MIP family channel protein [Sphingobacterium spiritivorum]WQD35024.1 MIP family channel protein [Sphingobacterium spiritivorum]SUI99133.1 Aquaporin Z 2 [Sphingobacterium spiritivorum]